MAIPAAGLPPPSPGRRIPASSQRDYSQQHKTIKQNHTLHHMSSHTLPEKPATWTYTVELRDKNDVALGKVSVVSITVWHGSADHGPEGVGDS
ncbi:MAG: hypothetical protein LBK99_18410 [Opitutaceae bacterium]|nr:hypothetical protein [Opitutaceae bacterium]